MQDGYNSDPTGNKSEYTTMINEEGGKLEKEQLMEDIILQMYKEV